MKPLLVGIGVVAGIVGVALLAVGSAQEVAVGLLVVGLICVGFTVGGSAGASSDV